MDKKNLKSYERRLLMRLQMKSDFMVLGDATDFIKEWADSNGVEIISMRLHSKDDIRGEKIIIKQNEYSHFNCRIWWLDMVNEHPEKNHLMLIYVEEADIDAINALKSFMENEPDNLFYGVICRDPNKEINSTINSLCKPIIRWGEDRE